MRFPTLETGVHGGVHTIIGACNTVACTAFQCDTVHCNIPVHGGVHTITRACNTVTCTAFQCDTVHCNIPVHGGVHTITRACNTVACTAFQCDTVHCTIRLHGGVHIITGTCNTVARAPAFETLTCPIVSIAIDRTSANKVSIWFPQGFHSVESGNPIGFIDKLHAHRIASTIEVSNGVP